MKRDKRRREKITKLISVLERGREIPSPGQAIFPDRFFATFPVTIPLQKLRPSIEVSTSRYFQTQPRPDTKIKNPTRI